MLLRHCPSHSYCTLSYFNRPYMTSLLLRRRQCKIGYFLQRILGSCFLVKIKFNLLIHSAAGQNIHIRQAEGRSCWHGYGNMVTQVTVTGNGDQTIKHHCRLWDSIRPFLPPLFFPSTIPSMRRLVASRLLL